MLPALRLELKALDVFLGPANSKDQAVCRASSRSEQAWADLWEALETLRLVCARPEAWEERFVGGLASLLEPRERLALPGEGRRVVFVSSDATVEAHAACDWQGGVAAREPVQPYLEALAAATGEGAEPIIAVAELLGFVAFAAVRAREWRGRLVAYVGDNTNARAWIDRRSPRSRAARMLLRVLGYLELSGGFQIITAYVRTYHNVTADAFSRCSAEGFERMAEGAGFRVVKLGAAWADVLCACFEHRVPALLGWDPADHGAAMRLRERRLLRAIPRALTLIAGPRLVELGATTCDFAVCWQRLRGQSAAHGARVCPGVRSHFGLGSDELGPGDLVAASLGPDASGREGVEVARTTVEAGCVGLVLEGPLQQPGARLLEGGRLGGHGAGVWDLQFWRTAGAPPLVPDGLRTGRGGG